MHSTRMHAVVFDLKSSPLRPYVLQYHRCTTGAKREFSDLRNVFFFLALSLYCIQSQSDGPDGRAARCSGQVDILVRVHVYNSYYYFENSAIMSEWGAHFIVSNATKERRRRRRRRPSDGEAASERQTERGRESATKAQAYASETDLPFPVDRLRRTIIVVEIGPRKICGRCPRARRRCRNYYYCYY